MVLRRPRLERNGHRPARLPPLTALALTLWLPFVFAMSGLPRMSGGTAIPTGRYSIPLAPLTLATPVPGWLGHPINFGYRCTLVDAAAILDYYGAILPQSVLALRLSAATDYTAARAGPPWWAYVSVPGRRPLLDVAVEQVGAVADVPVVAQTTIGLNFDRAVLAIAHNQPVILNVARTPDGTYNHSLLAYGYDTRDGHALLRVVDPNTQVSYWVGPETYWSETITTTYITPVGPSLMA
jgi:hypothetical protein